MISRSAVPPPQIRMVRTISVAKMGRVKMWAILSISLRAKLLNWRIEMMKPTIKRPRMMMSQIR